MKQGHEVARLLLKAAALSGAGKSLGKALTTAAKGAKKVVAGSADFGAGVAEGMGANPEIGKLVGGGAAVAAGLGTAGKVKRKTDEWRYRNGMYSQY